MMVHSVEKGHIEKPFVCVECGKGFYNKTHLKEHMTVHSGEKPFVCGECGRGLTTKSSLTSHQKVKHGIKSINTEEKRTYHQKVLHGINTEEKSSFDKNFY